MGFLIKIFSAGSFFGFGKRGLLEKGGLFRTGHFLEILENPQTVENRGESDHFLENLETLEILEIPPVKRRNDPFFRSRLLEKYELREVAPRTSSR